MPATDPLVSISSEVSLISAVLQQLGLSLQDDEYVKLCRKETLTQTQTVVEECWNCFSSIDEILSKYIDSGKLRLIDRLKWPQVAKKIELLRANLERLKTTLILMLEVLKYVRGMKRFISRCTAPKLQLRVVRDELIREETRERDQQVIVSLLRSLKNHCSLDQMRFLFYLH